MVRLTLLLDLPLRLRLLLLLLPLLTLLLDLPLPLPLPLLQVLAIKRGTIASYPLMKRGTQVPVVTKILRYQGLLLFFLILIYTK